MKADTILETIAAAARRRVEKARRDLPPDRIMEKALMMPPDTGFPFERALRGPDISFICECKKASPSKGLIAPDFPYKEIALSYEKAGASCISVLTEPQWFLGDDRYLEEIVQTVKIPCLRKDFTVDEYMIYEAKLLGASAVLLICSLLDTKTLEHFIGVCDRLGMSALTEAHDEAEIAMALEAGARIIGVNNRNLKDFSVNVNNSARLREMVPPGVIFVAESGIGTPEDIEILRSQKVDAVLIGEALMRAADKKRMLGELRGRPAPVRVKVCGLQSPEDADAVNKAGADMAGVILTEGFGRSVSRETAGEIRKRLSPSIPLTGVFVNTPPRAAASWVKEGIINMIQLHGDEDETWIGEFRSICAAPLIRAVKADRACTFRKAFDLPAAHVLVDSGTGSGKTFDWSLLDGLDRPYILAGGLNAHNVGEAVRRLHPWGVDVSSGVETDGRKDPEKILAFVREARKAAEMVDFGRLTAGNSEGGE